jgi:hypothetical protein
VARKIAAVVTQQFLGAKSRIKESAAGGPDFTLKLQRVSSVRTHRKPDEAFHNETSETSVAYKAGRHFNQSL